MCSFSGFVRNYPQISIDNFAKRNLQSSVYLLSHCHTVPNQWEKQEVNVHGVILLNIEEMEQPLDHMVGLDSSEFHSRLKLSGRSRVYTSEISKRLILNNAKFAHLEPYLETLPLETPITIQIPNDSLKTLEVVATFFPAGHCLGSVMILLEGDNGNVLYTGDFRLSSKELVKYKHLHCGKDKVKDINMLYFDATFSTPEALYIPSRQDSSKAIINLIEPWIAVANHHVHLICSAQYGYEYLFLELYRKFKMKVHVNKCKFRKYEGIIDILEAITCDPTDTRIHACAYSGDKDKKCEVLTIKLSAMWFAHHVSISDIVFKCDDNFYRICYSLHSSLTEIQSFISYLNPENIYPIAVPCGYTEKEVLKLLNHRQQNIDTENVTINGSTNCVTSLGPLVKSKYAEAAFGQSPEFSNSEENNCTDSAKSLLGNSATSNSFSPSDTYDSEKELFSSLESNAASPDKGVKRSCSEASDDHSCKSPKWKYEISSSDSESSQRYGVSVIHR